MRCVQYHTEPYKFIVHMAVLIYELYIICKLVLEEIVQSSLLQQFTCSQNEGLKVLFAIFNETNKSTWSKEKDKFENIFYGMTSHVPLPSLVV